MTTNELLRDEGVLILNSEIDNTKIKGIIEDIIYLNNKNDNKIKNIQIILNSPGGNCWDGFLLIDIIEYSKLEVFITGLGICASMGILILCSGTKGKRVITKNTLLLSHQYSWGSFGKYHELIADRKGQDILHKSMIKHYLKHTKLDEEQIEKILLPKSDVWLTPKEAKKYGIVDKIIE